MAMKLLSHTLYIKFAFSFALSCSFCTGTLLHIQENKYLPRVQVLLLKKLEKRTRNVKKKLVYCQPRICNFGYVFYLILPITSHKNNFCCKLCAALACLLVIHISNTSTNKPTVIFPYVYRTI